LTICYIRYAGAESCINYRAGSDIHVGRKTDNIYFEFAVE